MIYVHDLEGCAPTPLAHYLKALGILRVVAEQRDPAVRGWWKDEAFHLATTLTRAELETFFLEEYAPSPIVAPWNGGSGFYAKDKQDGIRAIEGARGKRFAAYREAIEIARREIGARREAAKKQEKNDLIASMRRSLRGAALQALDAAIILTGDGQPKYPSLLGTGWNDGRLDFSNNFMQRLAEQFDCAAECSGPFAHAKELMQAALWGMPQKGMFKDKAVGQFLPGNAGGANATTGAEGQSLLNPWDFILMLEGALLFAAAATRRSSTMASVEVSAPFSTRSASVGYGSASRDEAAKRGEQWMPLWEQPASFGDVKQLLAAGRVQLGIRPAARPLEFARSVARLGISRGITAFERFGYLERNGQANFAVPLGRWVVQAQARQTLLDDLDRGRWMETVQRAARDEHTPKSVAIASQNLDTSILLACAQGSEATRWQSVLSSLAGLEHAFRGSGKLVIERRLQPIPPLSPGWAQVADDGSPEFRLALALATQAADRLGKDAVRHHWLPLERGRFATDAGGLRKDSRVVCQGLEPERDLVALVQRRLMEGGRGAETRLPLVGVAGFEASLGDISAFLAGTLDCYKVVNLACAFMALDRRKLAETTWRPRCPAKCDVPIPAYALFRLACLPWPLRRGTGSLAIRCDPAIVARLAAGDLPSAGDIAIRRLKAVGLVPKFRRVAGDGNLARRLAASLAFPISPRTAVRLAEELTRYENNK